MVDRSILREIDEDIRNERIGKLWKQYGRYLIGIAVAIVISILGYKVLEFTQLRQAQSQGDAFLSAFTLSNESIEATEKVEELFEEIETAQEEINRLRDEEKSKREEAERNRSSAKSQLERTRSQQSQDALAAKESGGELLSPFILTPDPVTQQTEEILDIAVKDEYEDPELTKNEEKTIEEKEIEKAEAEAEEKEKEEKALVALKELEENASTIYTAMAQLRRASILAKQDKQQEALEIYDEVINRSSVDENFRLIARVRSAFLLVDLGSVEDVQTRTEPLMQDEESAYISLAREALGLAHYKADEIKQAAELFHEIKDDNKAPRGLKRRADTMLELFAAQGVLSPQQEEINKEEEEEAKAAKEAEEAEDEDEEGEDTESSEVEGEESDTETAEATAEEN